MRLSAGTWRRIARDYGLSLSFWLPLAVLLAWQQYRILSEEQMQITIASTLMLVGARFFTYALLTPPLFTIVVLRPITSGAVIPRCLCYLLGFVPFALLFAVIRWCLVPPWYPTRHQWGSRNLDALIGLMNTTFADELAVYVAVLVAAHCLVYYRRTQRQELEQMTLRQALTQSELHTLQMQIQPHFLFNTLHGIASLMHSDASRAEQMLLRLSSLLRHTMQQNSSDLIPLGDDLRLSEDYLDIEGMRLGSRMTVQWAIDPATRGLLVPRAMFQLLVENGVKHGIASRRGQGWIEITSRQVGRNLRLEVRNSVNGEATHRVGVGHQNIRTRLELLYDGEAKFFFENREKIAVSTLILPVLTAAAATPGRAAVTELEAESR